MGQTGCAELSVRNLLCTLRNKVEEPNIFGGWINTFNDSFHSKIHVFSYIFMVCMFSGIEGPQCVALMLEAWRDKCVWCRSPDCNSERQIL